jgi:dolichol-phosphate mannosyltransferase
MPVEGAMESQPGISVVVPTLNEVENVDPLVRAVMHCGVKLREIIFVDDGSIDGTPERIRELAERYPVRLVERAGPGLGLASAVRAGARAATGNLLVVMDGDLSHPPEKIPALLRPLLEGGADMVIGSRYVRGGATPGWPIWRRAMSRFASLLAYPLTGVRDSMGGFFALRRHLLLQSIAEPRGFKIAFEMLVHSEPQLRVIEIPIVFRDRVRGVSKMTFAVALTFASRWFSSASKMAQRKFALAFFGRAALPMQPAIES